MTMMMMERTVRAVRARVERGNGEKGRASTPSAAKREGKPA